MYHRCARVSRNHLLHEGTKCPRRPRIAFGQNHFRDLPDSSCLRDKPVHWNYLANAFSTVCTSLSPRPDKFTSTMADGPSSLARDRKSTRLNSSHLVISYAV